MHRFPKIFSGEKKAAGGGSNGRTDSNFKQKKPRPRLERRNAIRNIDYELPSTSSTSSVSSSDDYLFSPTSSFGSPSTSVSAAQQAHSLDIHSFDKLTSFRIQGNCPGEFEIICRSLGLSGPEDFSIPAEAWADMKFRSSSSDVFPRLSRFNYDGGGGSGDEINRKSENTALEDDTCRVGDVIRLKPGSPDFGSSPDSTPSPKVNDVINEGGVIQVLEASATPARCSDEMSSDMVGFSSRPGCCRGNGSIRLGHSFVAGFVENEGGSDVVSNEHVGVEGIGCSIIKGVRPPPLSPPPAMSLPPIDSGCSTWDLLKSFAPDDNEDSLRPDGCEAVSSEDEESRKKDEDKGDDDGDDEEVVHYVVDSRRSGGVESALSESCSFTTSNDDDSSSTTTDPSYNISPNTRFNSPNGTFKRIITYWQKGELLGRGSFGTVYEGIADGGFFFAVKEVSLLDQGTEAQQSIHQLEQEIALLRQFEHENIVQYYGTDKDDSKLYIFLELVTKGSLLSLYQKYHLRDSQVSAYTRQILHGLKYLHDRNVVHRDIKCANILVDANGSVKLADFGLAKATKLNDVKSCKGTALWMAPEVVNGRNQGYGLAADIWSLGCTVLEMITGQFPYSHLETSMQALFRIGKGEPPRVPESLSRDARDFIRKCLQVNPNARPTAVQLLNHPFVQRSLQFSGPASPYHPSRRSAK